MVKDVLFLSTNPKYLFHLSFLYNNLHTYFYKIPYSSSIHSTHSTLKQLFTIFLHNTYFSVHVSITLKTTLNSMTTSHIILKFEGITSMKNTPTRMQKLRFEGWKWKSALNFPYFLFSPPILTWVSVWYRPWLRRIQLGWVIPFSAEILNPGLDRLCRFQYFILGKGKIWPYANREIN